MHWLITRQVVEYIINECVNRRTLSLLSLTIRAVIVEITARYER